MRDAGISEGDINYWFTNGTGRESTAIDYGSGLLSISTNSTNASRDATFYSTQDENDIAYDEEIDREVSEDYRSEDDDSDDYIDSILDETNFKPNIVQMSELNNSTPPPPPSTTDLASAQSRRSSLADSSNQSTRSPPPPPPVVDAQSRRSSLADSTNQSTRSPPPPPPVVDAQSRRSSLADSTNQSTRSPPPPPPVSTDRRYSLNNTSNKFISQESIIEGYSKLIDEIIAKFSSPSIAATKLVKELDNLLAKKENDLARLKKDSLPELNHDELKMKEKLLGVHQEVYNDFISQSSVMAYPVGQFSKLLPHYQVHNHGDAVISGLIHDINERLNSYATERLTRHHHMIVESLTERIDIHINGIHKACGEMQKFIHKEKSNFRNQNGINVGDIEKSIENDYNNSYKYYKNVEQESNSRTDMNIQLYMGAITEIEKWAIEKFQLHLSKCNSICTDNTSNEINERVSKFCDFYLDQLSHQLNTLQMNRSKMNAAIIENAMWKKDTVVMNQDWLTATVSGMERIYCNEMESIMNKLLDHGRIKNEWMVNSIPINNYNLKSGGMAKVPMLPMGDRIKDLGLVNDLDCRKIEDYLLQILRS